LQLNRPFLPLVLGAAVAAASLSPLVRAGAQRSDRAAPVTTPVSAPISNVRYAVTFDQSTARSRSLRVTMTFSVSGNDPVLLSMPAWTPGAYEISDYVRKVTAFAVTGEGGTPRWDKFDPDTWRLVPNGARTITISFSYSADSMDNAMSWANRDFAFFNGTNVMPYPEGRGTDFAATVTVNTDAGWEVATGITPGATPRTWTQNYHDCQTCVRHRPGRRPLATRCPTSVSARDPDGCRPRAVLGPAAENDAADGERVRRDAGPDVHDPHPVRLDDRRRGRARALELALRHLLAVHRGSRVPSLDHGA
jgi:hypothetical protein